MSYFQSIRYWVLEYLSTAVKNHQNKQQQPRMSFTNVGMEEGMNIVVRSIVVDIHSINIDATKGYIDEPRCDRQRSTRPTYEKKHIWHKET